MAKRHQRNASLFLYFVRVLLSGKIGSLIVLILLATCFIGGMAYMMGWLGEQGR